MRHKHLSLEERYYIETALKKGDSQNMIAKSLHRSQGTISKEVHRNQGERGYRYKQAQRFTDTRHQEKPKAIKMTDEIKLFIKEQLESNQSSPEQIAGRLKKVQEISLHHETIYRYIIQDKKDNGELYLHLRHKQKPYRKRYGSASTNSAKGIPDRVDIDERSDEINNRERVGDWEGDTVIGAMHKGAIVTLDERVSKLRLALPMIGKFAQDTKDAIIELLEPIKAFVKSITFDNGKEFAKHKDMANTLAQLHHPNKKNTQISLNLSKFQRINP
jgi:IS30 family transposase